MGGKQIPTSRGTEYRLTNSPTVFQTFVNEILRDLLNQNVIVYIDDILIYSSTIESHIKQVCQVLPRLLYHQLFVKAKKCEFHRDTVSFLRYIINGQLVKMDPHKIAPTQ